MEELVSIEVAKGLLLFKKSHIKEQDPVATVFVMIFLVMLYFCAGALDEDTSIFKDDQPSINKYNFIEQYHKSRSCRVYISGIRFFID